MKPFAKIEYLFSTHTKKDFIIDETPEYLILGRSNVGKSTLINAIGNSKKLAKVSGKPGKTRSLNFFNINDGTHRLVDVPGYGYAKVSNLQKDLFESMMSDYFYHRPNTVGALLLVDLRHKPTQDDIGMFQFLMSRSIPTMIVGTKLDKLNQKQRAMIPKHMKAFPVDIKLFKTSSTSKVGLKEITDKLFN